MIFKFKLIKKVGTYVLGIEKHHFFHTYAGVMYKLCLKMKKTTASAKTGTFFTCPQILQSVM